MIEKIINLDTELFLYLNKINSPFFDNMMWHISGKFEWMPLYFLIIYFIFKKFKKQGFLVLLFLIIAVAIADLISVHLFKNVFERLRPCHNSEIEMIVHTVNGYCGGKYGFVSSHAANTFSLASFTVLLFKNKFYSIAILFWASTVCYSRIYLGVHYPLDIIGGIIIGIISGLLLFLLLVQLKVVHNYKLNN